MAFESQPIDLGHLLRFEQKDRIARVSGNVDRENVMFDDETSDIVFGRQAFKRKNGSRVMPRIGDANTTNPELSTPVPRIKAQATKGLVGKRKTNRLETIMRLVVSTHAV